ncbi:nicotinamide n-methyltransferase [Rhizoclosmatium sp. JEL0117]|nr:nicotinamide n-methyltransferase [Rhizoclosmatium sp. JEL0117]
MSASEQTTHAPTTTSTEDEDDEDLFDTNLFEEPEGFRPSTPPPTYETYTRNPSNVQQNTPHTLDIQKMGARDSLWAHRVWNGSLVLAEHLDCDKTKTQGKRVLELGCAAAIPSMLSAINGAECVVATDYPNPVLMKTIARNLETNCPEQWKNGTLKLVPHQWGHEVQEVIAALPDTTRKFDVIYLADLIFNHTEHRALLTTCKAALEPGPQSAMYVYFSSHVVKWAHKDLAFFEIAKEEEFGFCVEQFDKVKATAMFPDDVGDLEVRETVHCYRMWLPLK